MTRAQRIDGGGVDLFTTTTTPSAATAPRGGGISTAEIKARIARMFADDPEPDHPGHTESRGRPR
ncbi:MULTISPECIES: hypothetical protein [Rhodococcus]|uniref:hypothetical protein n=1 Tax=Rhodococcus TaxID=1827 RepID=UPI000587200B|nr:MULTISPECIES: hypothetical protein [Rhodococcus]QQZ19443.1 hypothetical protein GO592_38900 [Rhodococcus sp. 21391]UOT08150.1 hypothetical protein MPY17_37995 [Rhodococcus opacus]